MDTPGPHTGPYRLPSPDSAQWVRGMRRAIGVARSLGMERQHQQVRSQLALNDYTNIINRQYAVMGDNAAAAIAKARTNPDQLTEEEKLIAHAHLSIAS